MKSIVFIDTEIEPKARNILDIGSVKDNEASFHEPSVVEFKQFLLGTEFVCGHNILNHDIKYVGKILHEANINSANIIDTLFRHCLIKCVSYRNAEFERTSHFLFTNFIRV